MSANPPSGSSTEKSRDTVVGGWECWDIWSDFVRSGEIPSKEWSTEAVKLLEECTKETLQFPLDVRTSLRKLHEPRSVAVQIGGERYVGRSYTDMVLGHFGKLRDGIHRACGSRNSESVDRLNAELIVQNWLRIVAEFDKRPELPIKELECSVLQEFSKLESATVPGGIRPNPREARDQVIYERCCSGTTYSDIIAEVPEKWPQHPIETPNGIKSAAARYAARHNLPMQPVRIPGRPTA